MSTHVTRLCFLLMLMLASADVQSAAPGNAPENASSRPLFDVLREFQARGVPLSFSSNIVRPAYRVSAIPEGQDNFARLSELLAPFGLYVERAERVWFVRRNVRTTDDPPAPPPAPAAVAEMIEEIVVTSSRYALVDRNRASHTTLDSDDFNVLPELGDDALRVVQHLPGTASLGLSARPHIRGGLQDETLLLFHNVELLEPFHLKDFQSVFSTLNPSVIESIEVYTGGFPARYGGRMSGVMDIRAHDQFVRRLGGELAVSPFTSSALLYATSESGDQRMTLSARRGNLDWITRRLNSSVGEPSYSDWFARYAFSPLEHVDVDVGVLAYDDDVVLQDLEDGVGEFAHSRYENAYAWVQISRQLSPTWQSHTLLSAGRIRHGRDGFINDDEADESVATIRDRRRFEVFSLSHAYTQELGVRVASEYGIKLVYQRGRYRYDAVIERGELAELIDIPIDIARAIALNPNGLSGSAFASLKSDLSERWHAELGLRWDFQDYGPPAFEQQLSPRFSLRFDPWSDAAFRLSVGRFFQPEGINELQVSDGLVDFQSPQRADHAIVSFEQSARNHALVFRVEGFAKAFHNPKVRFENLFNPLVLLPEVKPDRIRIAATRAKARGVEVSLRYQPNDTVSLWTAFTHASVKEKVAGRWRSRRWDQKQSLDAGLSIERGRWSFAVVSSWHSGWRSTALPLSIDEIEPVNLDFYRTTLRDFHSLDVRLNRQWRFGRHALNAYLEITNGLNRTNIGGFEYELEEDDDTGELEVVREARDMLPLAPSIGLRWTF